MEVKSDRMGLNWEECVIELYVNVASTTGSMGGD